MTRRVAVVLFNLGGPDSPEAVRPFLFNLFHDPAIISLPQPLRWLVARLISGGRHKTAQAIYARIGGSSPLVKETEAQRQALADLLCNTMPDLEIEVVVAMRYWRPFTKAAAAQVEAFAPDDIILLPLYPQFSTTTTGSSLLEWNKVYKGGTAAHAVCCYPESPGLIEAHARQIEATVASARATQPLRIIFSAHGLPQKIIDGGDPYQHQVERSAAALARRLNAADWRVSYQSRVGPLKWIGPSTIEALEEAGRDKAGVVVVPIAFVSEHSETLVELDIEYRELAEHAGVPLYLRAPDIGVQPPFIEELAAMVAQALSSPAIAPYGAPCQGRFPKCPLQCKAKGA